MVLPQSGMSDSVVSPWEALYFLRSGWGAGIGRRWRKWDEGEGVGMEIALQNEKRYIKKESSQF